MIFEYHYSGVEGRVLNLGGLFADRPPVFAGVDFFPNDKEFKWT